MTSHRTNWLLIAALAFLCIAADAKYRNLQITKEGVLDATNVVVLGNVTAAQFVGDGSLLSGVMPTNFAANSPLATNIVRAITNQIAAGAPPAAAGMSLMVMEGSNNPPHVWSNAYDAIEWAATNETWSTSGGTIWINGMVNCPTNRLIAVATEANPGVMIRGTNGGELAADLTSLADSTAFVTISATNWGMEGVRVLAYSDGADNQRFLFFSASVGNTFDSVTAMADGANANLCVAVYCSDTSDTIIRRSVFTVGEEAGSGCAAMFLYNATVATVDSSVFDVQYMNLGAGSGLTFNDCYFIGRHATAGALHNVPDGTVINGCRFITKGGGPTLYGSAATVYGNFNCYTNLDGVSFSGIRNKEWGVTDYKSSWITRALGVK